MAGRKHTQRARPARPEPTLFDFERGGELKDEGMARAAAGRASLLAYARGLAVEIAMARPDRCVTADDVQAALAERGVSVHALGNAAGALFAGGAWEWTGRWVKSRRAHAHHNPLRVWRYVGG